SPSRTTRASGPSGAGPVRPASGGSRPVSRTPSTSRYSRACSQPTRSSSRPRARSADVWREFFGDMRAQKLRTSLTVLGIAWGTVAVVVLLAFGIGLERQTRKRFHGLGDRIVILWGGRTTKPFAGFGDGLPIRLQAEDVPLLARE